MGGALSTSTDPTSSQSEATGEQGEKTAEKIRFGQKMSEEGMGGQTTTSIGDAQQEGELHMENCYAEVGRRKRGGVGEVVICGLMADNCAGGLGDADVSANEESAAQSRREQGYGGDEDMDRTIGA